MTENLKIDFSEVSKKNEIIDNVTKKLKQDFIGIDEQIDGIMNNVRTWYLFPQLQSSPIIINLWGLTGVGKTSLVKSLAKYLGLEKDMVYFNFAQISEMSSYDVEDEIEDVLENENPIRIFVYDEFQYAATIDEDGTEKDRKSGLKPFWELLDTGILHKRLSYRTLKRVKQLLYALNIINDKTQIIIQNGEWTNYKECLLPFTDYDIAQFHEVLNFSLKETKNSENQDVELLYGTYTCASDVDRSANNDGFYVNGSIYVQCDNNFIVNTNALRDLIGLYAKCGYKICDDFDLMKVIKKMSFNELLSFIEEVHNKALKGYDLKFDKSVIFVLGNLDEAYEMSFNTNPDMSPDQFNRLSKKITVVDIKQALQKRFRNEQIARLGNIHLIYPSFSSSTFKKIISQTLHRFANEAEDLCGYKLNFEKSIKDIIYKEAVFPTHGTRPIFSTVHEMVKSKLPLVLNNMYNDEIEQKGHIISYGFKAKKIIITIYDCNNHILAKYSFNDNLRVNSLRDSTKDNEQALVAVHESGHFVIYSSLYNKMPEKLCSKSADRNIGGFLIEDEREMDVLSATEIVNNIKVALGGYVAEEIIFGKTMMSNGASSDLINATILASKYVRKWGLSNYHYVSTYGLDAHTTHEHNIINESCQENINHEIKKLIDDCYDEVYNTLNNPEWMKMLKASAKHLSQHSSMPKKKMQELYDMVDNSVKNNVSNHYHKDIVAQF